MDGRCISVSIATHLNGSRVVHCASTLSVTSFWAATTAAPQHAKEQAKRVQIGYRLLLLQAATVLAAMLKCAFADTANECLYAILCTASVHCAGITHRPGFPGRQGPPASGMDRRLACRAAPRRCSHHGALAGTRSARETPLTGARLRVHVSQGKGRMCMCGGVVGAQPLLGCADAHAHTGPLEQTAISYPLPRFVAP